ncbi:DNA sulfur modification protein DndD [Parashewanella spongiae]|uniref:DNA sulfur modification protein DndD n=1 Tax=Parashewanella spongiae TaxID=342950 RepID=A0A3A6U670_9GAMM|nr:DNA sulfur modification protein DndD [Parashewanella spongiae]MCL1076574.1 DNA sulfur modification protein DndD [Parashewanella spongiae]RJY19533.1 DNA sulfur modification protein DndD [Parashewanella spongiae]
MIFEQLTLINFGIYQGQHIIDLDKVNSSKPIVLFGGLNGGGKTTFLDSLQLALYGKHAKCSNRGRMSYSDFLKQAINRYSEGEKASVSLKFKHKTGIETNHYQITRQWQTKGSQEITDNVTVLVNGEQDDLLTENWNDFVSEFIPQSLSELFFFDGEKIEDLADPSRSAQLIKTGVEALLGLELFSQLTKDLKTQRQRRQERNLTSEASQRANELQERKTQLESNLTELEEDTKKTIQEKEDLEELLKNKEIDLRASGAHLIDSLADVQAAQGRVQSKIEATDANLIKAAASALPLILAKGLLNATKVQSEKEVKSKELQTAQKFIKQQHTDLIEQLKDSLDADAITKIEVALSSIENKATDQVKDTTHYLNSSPAIFDFALSSLDSEAQECALLLKDKQKLKEQLALADKKFDAIPDADSVKEHVTEKHKLELRIDQKRTHLESNIEEINHCKKMMNDVDARLDATLLQQNIETFEQERNQSVAEHLSEMQQIIESFKDDLINENIHKLETKIKSKFGQLERKSNLISKVEINPKSFHLTLIGSDDKLIEPKRLSAGERQLLSVAILWALADESGKEIPTIIDTPMGRLDGEHRTKLVENYFPQAANQVILLSTDEEISGQYYQNIKPYVASEYHIQYQENLKTSTITNGYFGERK